MFFTGLGIVLCSVIFFVRFYIDGKSRGTEISRKNCKSYEEIILNYAWSLLCARFSFVLFRKKLCRER